ncbi:MAG TPA: leucyl aminopeptidase family protein [Micropepsaceae bacterium]|nr:leucyl aminopeptidase family protein [Micropepsaceae bacterium]
MMEIFESQSRGEKPIPVHAVLKNDLERFLDSRPPQESSWLKAIGFAAKDGELALIPDGTRLGSAVLGLGAGRDPHALALFSERLPPGSYALSDVPEAFAGARAAYAWAIGSYSFDRYRAAKKVSRKEVARLVIPPGVDGEAVSRIADGVFFARDLINTPANDMGPQELEAAARIVAERFGARLSVILGDALTTANYPMIHTVGRASSRAPRLIDFIWGAEVHPKVTLVGKGVCFDTGGLDLKNSSGMLTMKKDMGGAACVLGLAQMIMPAKLAVRLRVMIPAVENSVSGSSYRPGDVIPSRKGLHVEIGNTDAEGRLVLADALAEADAERPALMFSLATLTGAARAATGMELPPFFTDDEALASDLMRHGTSEHDPLWRLPLWRSYEPTVDSQIADVNNAPDYALAGAITAALFINRFITETTSWAHFDIPAWTDRPKPGRRKGAEANTIRALFALIAERYGKKT